MLPNLIEVSTAFETANLNGALPLTREPVRTWVKNFESEDAAEFVCATINDLLAQKARLSQVQGLIQHFHLLLSEDQNKSSGFRFAHEVRFEAKKSDLDYLVFEYNREPLCYIRLTYTMGQNSPLCFIDSIRGLNGSELKVLDTDPPQTAWCLAFKELVQTFKPLYDSKWQVGIINSKDPNESLKNVYQEDLALKNIFIAHKNHGFGKDLSVFNPLDQTKIFLK